MERPDTLRKNQVCDSKSEYANVAQSVEQLIRNQQVMCSSHTTSSKKALKSQRFRGFCFFQYICEGHFCVLFVSYSRKNVFRRAKKPVRINT